MINLIDVELDDTGDITGGADEKLITDALRNQGSLLYGDTDFSGTIDWRFRPRWSVRTEVGTIGAGVDLLWQYRY